MTRVIDGEAAAAALRSGLRDAVGRLADAGHRPGLATVLMSEDPASETYVELKQDDCEEVGIETFDRRIDPDAPAARLHDALAELNADDRVDGVLVQLPLPEHVDERAALRRVAPEKDVDGFHPENLGRLVAGNPRFVPCTPAAVRRLLDGAGVQVAGADVTVVGRGLVVGRPLSVLLAARGTDATVTTCHSRTADLAAQTRGADVVVAAAGVPELVDGDMLSEGTTVVDVGVNRVDRDGESVLVGDVDFASAEPVVDAITPVPGGVGPMTRAMLLHNTTLAAVERTDADVDVTLP